MKTIQDNTCECTTATEGSNSIKQKSCSSSSDKQYACNKLSDPDWIRENIEYFPAGFAASKGIFKNISPKETYQMIQGKNKYIILDVKTKQEYRQKHLSRSPNIDFFSSTFKDELFCLDKDTCYFVICKIGVRSEIAMNIMKKMGFKEVYNVIGGDDRWIAEEIPYGHEETCNADISNCVSV